LQKTEAHELSPHCTAKEIAEPGSEPRS
jgi:hypothetical protein